MKGNKWAAGTIAIVTAAAVTVTAILSNGVQSTYAQESFSGLDEIIDGKEYKILEIVPDLSEAKLGLLVSGQESYYDPQTGHYGSLETVLSGMGTRAERKAYIASVCSNYSDILSESDDAVLKSTAYQESYVPVEGYKQRSLTSARILDKDSDDLSGYYMKDLGENAVSGQYVLDAKFILATDRPGSSGALYSQNISYYDISAENKYYNIEFLLTDTVAEGMGAYQPKDGAPITQEMWDRMEPGELFYMLSSDGASFILCQKSLSEENGGTESLTTDGNGTEATGGTGSGDDGLTKVAEYQSNRFYMVYFEYVAPENIDTAASRCYYEPYSVTFAVDDSGSPAGKYGAVLNTAQPYVEDSANGHFIKDVDNMYYMKSETGGRYELVKTGEGEELTAYQKLQYDVEVDCFYYKGGISSNDTLKNAVFNQSGLLDEQGAQLDIKVDAVLPRNVTVEMANEYDLIYLSDSFLYSLKSDPASYAADNDLTGNVANVIYSLVTDATVYKPVIVDAGILSEDGISDTNVYKLARLLSSNNLDENTASYKDDTWTVTYGSSYADANNDGYFVNGNVFSVPGDGTELVSDGLLRDHKFSFLDDFAEPFIQQTQEFRSEYENFSADAETAFQTSAAALGFGEVAGCISDENFIRESENVSKTLDKDKYKFFDLSISRAICVEYIICYVSRRETSNVSTISVLDIEPCTASSATQAKIESNIRELLGITDSGITINFTHMTSAELISKVEDLCKYDLIYMGLCTDSMNTTQRTIYYLKSDTNKEYPLESVSGISSYYYTSESVTVTNYNDTSMKGLIYTSIGDIRRSYSFAGVLDSDYKLSGNVYSRAYKAADGTWVSGTDATYGNYSTVRYSGNDLTEEKLSDLVDYVKSAAPVILADDFLTTIRQEDGTYKRVVNDKQTLYKTKLSNNSYVLDGASTETMNGTIDNCSRMYELIDDIAVTTTYKNVKTYSEWQDNKSLLNRYVTLGKPKLEVMESAKVDGEEYIKTDGDNVVIDFRVKSYGSVQTDAAFTADLFVDFNADGRYSKTTEKLDVYSYNIYLVDQKENSKKKINPVTTTIDGKETTFYSLPALNGKTNTQYYSLEYAVQKSYLGVYPVKLVVEQQDNEYRYSYWEGYYYHEKTAVSASEGTTKEVIKVIQILPDWIYTDEGGSLFDMDLTGSYENGSDTQNTKYADLFKNKYKTHTASEFYSYDTDVKPSSGSTYTERQWNDANNQTRWNMLIDSFANSSFYKYAYDTGASGNKMGGYELQIDSVYASSLAEYFTTQIGYTFSFDEEGYQEFLDYYDMLILGFGDSGSYFRYVYKDTSGKRQQNVSDYYYMGIHNFIESGKSVLFTHDTTSYHAVSAMNGYSDPTWDTGHLSDLLAGDVGFDRYGVYDNEDSLLSLVLSAGIDGLTRGGGTQYTISKYPSLAKAKRLGLLAEYDSSLTAGSSKDTISEKTLFEIIERESDEEHENKDVAYEPNSNKNVLTYEVQGRSTICINVEGMKDSNYKLTNFSSKLNGTKVLDDWRNNILNRTYHAELLNVGQILIYPYNVYDEIVNNDNLLDIAQTHYQYFQIDMNADEDNDGESDITVWLSLTDKGNGNDFILYDVAERDARNNYYIYTKGNITYSGVGHHSINSADYTAETQLYINTIIASYQTTVQKPEVSIKESANTGSPDKDTIYVSMDSSITVDSNGIGTVDDGTVSLDNDQITSDSYQTATGSDGKEYWTADVTRTDGEKDVSTFEEAYLYIQDTNVTRGTVKQIKLNYYLMLDSEDDVPDESLKGLVVNLNAGKKGVDPEWAIPLNLETYSLIYDEDGNEGLKTFDEQSEEVVSGKYYRIDIPYYVLASAKKRAEVRCYVTTTISKKNTLTGATTKISESTNYDSIYLQRISLFDLE